MMSRVLPLPPVPDEISGAVVVLEQGGPYRLGETGIVELDAQIGASR